jgi:hypothetical protein
MCHYKDYWLEYWNHAVQCDCKNVNLAGGGEVNIHIICVRSA